MKMKRKKYAAGTSKVAGGTGSGDTIGAIAAGAGMLLQAVKPAPKKQDGTFAPPGEEAVQVTEGGSAIDVASSAASGAAMGASVGGPWGALVGGVVGAGAGVVNYSAAEKAHEESLKKRNLQVQRYNRSNIGADSNSLAQVGQYKKGSKGINTKAIEIEGKEPLFSKKVNGKRTLKVYEHNGPTHEEGGIPVLAQEGDAVITAKDNLGPAAVAAHQRGDHELVEKLINKMPADKGQGKAKGGKRKVVAKAKPRDPNVDSVTGRPIIRSTPWDPTNGYASKGPEAMGMQQSLNAAGYKLDVDGKPGAHTRAAYNDFKGLNAPILNQQQIQAQAPAIPKQLAPLDTSKLPVTTPAVKNNTVKQRSAGSNAAVKVAEAAPTLFNLTQGLFGETEKTARRGYSPALQNYEDMSGPQRQQSRVAKNMQIANARNLSGGSAGNARANTNQAFADDVTRQNAIDQGEVGRRMGITAANNDLTSKAQLINNQMNDNADNLDLQNAAKKQEALSKGLEGISGLASNSILTDNKLDKEASDRAMLSEAYRTMTIDPATGKPVLRSKLAADGTLPTKRKGMKSLKMKKNC